MPLFTFFVEVDTRVYEVDENPLNRKFLFDYKMRIRAVNYDDAERIEDDMVNTSSPYLSRNCKIVLGVRIMDKMQYFNVHEIDSLLKTLSEVHSELFDPSGNLKARPVSNIKSLR